MKINPESQFRPTVKNVSEILAYYSLTLVRFKPANSGIENCTLFIETSSGDYVLRIYRQAKKSESEILLEINFVTYLYEHGLPVAKPLPNTTGSTVTQFRLNTASWFAILMPRMKGTHATSYSDELIASLAKLQAKIHLLAPSFKENSAAIHPTLRESYFIQLIPDRQTLDAHRAGFVERAEAYVVHLSEELPAGFCHLDYDNGNVLTDSDRVTAILDFDDLAFAPLVQCLAYSVWDVLFERGMLALQSYVAAYEKMRPLQNIEHDFLIPIVLFRHYVIGCKDIADNQMSDLLLKRYLAIEDELLQLASALPQ
ncbi:MAG: phosphotransferase [Candidatus Saccharibacteria bacterium]|nr:phosphotransferase [Candidatus Saccharibacteria bacterium]